MLGEERKDRFTVLTRDRFFLDFVLLCVLPAFLPLDKDQAGPLDHVDAVASILPLDPLVIVSPLSLLRRLCQIPRGELSLGPLEEILVGVEIESRIPRLQQDDLVSHREAMEEGMAFLLAQPTGS